MTEAEFVHNLAGADQLRRTATPFEAGYWTGYTRGLRRFFHGENFGTTDEHAAWLDHRDARGTGYLDGYHGLSVKEAIRECELREERAEWERDHPDFVRGVLDAQEES